MTTRGATWTADRAPDPWADLDAEKMSPWEAWTEILRRLAAGLPLPASLEGHEEAVRRSAAALLADVPETRNAARTLVSAPGRMTLDEDPGESPRAEDEDPHYEEKKMGWREKLLRSIEDVATRTRKVENALRAEGYLDGDGGRADNRRRGGEADVEVRSILSGPRGQAVCDRAENRREGEGGRFNVRSVLSGRRGESVLDED
jgi:hypothetical protein